jgi:hypothetical protein
LTIQAVTILSLWRQACPSGLWWPALVLV